MKTTIPRPWLWAGLALAIVVAFISWVALPLSAKSKELNTRITEAKRQLEDAERLSNRLEILKTGVQVPALPQGFSLFAFIEAVATDQKIKENIEQMSPAVRETASGRKESEVSLRLVRVPLQGFLNFLLQTQQATEGVRVRNLQIRPNIDGTLDVDLTVMVFMPK